MSFKVHILWEGHRQYELQIKPDFRKLDLFNIHFLCWIFGVVPFNTWLISSWEKNYCCYKLSKWQNDNIDHVVWKIDVIICAFAHLLTTFIFFSTWDKSHVEWDNFRNLTQCYSCNNITTTLIQISHLFFGFFSKTSHQMII